jgi:hypothetical protein
MGMPPEIAVTALLKLARSGDSAALDQLLSVPYQELHRLSRAALRGERPDHTLQPTALLNEAYLRIFSNEKASL